MTDYQLFSKGCIYKSKTHGMVEYIGLDRYFGQTTLHFKSITYGSDQYWLPETIEDHIQIPQEKSWQLT